MFSSGIQSQVGFGLPVPIGIAVMVVVGYGGLLVRGEPNSLALASRLSQ